MKVLEGRMIFGSSLDPGLPPCVYDLLTHVYHISSSISFRPACTHDDRRILGQVQQADARDDAKWKFEITAEGEIDFEDEMRNASGIGRRRNVCSFALFRFSVSSLNSHGPPFLPSFSSHQQSSSRPAPRPNAAAGIAPPHSHTKSDISSDAPT